MRISDTPAVEAFVVQGTEVRIDERSWDEKLMPPFVAFALCRSRSQSMSIGNIAV